MVFAKEEFVDSLVQLLFPPQASIKVKNPITQMVAKSKEGQKKKLFDLKNLALSKRGRKKVNYLEYRPYKIA